MTSHLQRVLDHQDVKSLTFLAIRHPGWDRKLLALYKKIHRHSPRDIAWPIDGGPPTMFIGDGRVTAEFKFMVVKHTEHMSYILLGSIETAIPVGKSDHEWVLVITGTLWRYGVNDRDGVKAEQITIPCFYNSHTRKGFGLVTLITSYEVYGASPSELQRD